MQKITFEWDENKARSNLQKHGVSFEEAMSVFYDEMAIEFYDDAHSEWEERFLLIGDESEHEIVAHLSLLS